MTRTHHPEPHFQLRLVLGKDVVIGPGKADLLEAIRTSGSIASASRQLGMSYKKAWQLINTMNSCLKNPVVMTTSGGQARGGAQLTESGEALLSHYRHLETQLTADNPEARSLLSMLDPQTQSETD